MTGELLASHIDGRLASTTFLRATRGSGHRGGKAHRKGEDPVNMELVSPEL